MQDIQDSPTVARPTRAATTPLTSILLPWLILALALVQGLMTLQLSQSVAGIRAQIRAMERSLPALADQKIHAALPALDERTRRLEAALQSAEARIERRFPQLVDNYLENKLRRFERR